MDLYSSCTVNNNNKQEVLASNCWKPRNIDCCHQSASKRTIAEGFSRLPDLDLNAKFIAGGPCAAVI